MNVERKLGSRRIIATLLFGILPIVALMDVFVPWVDGPTGPPRPAYRRTLLALFWMTMLVQLIVVWRMSAPAASEMRSRTRWEPLLVLVAAYFGLIGATAVVLRLR